MRPRPLVIAGLLATLGLSAALAQTIEPNHPLTGSPSLAESGPVPPIPQPVTGDLRQSRSYPEQPPVIPHSIRDYQIDLNSNKCLTCHAREFTAATQAPMISITHFVDRDGQMLAGVAPRRYFCTACHVPQTRAEPPVANTFEEIGTLSTLRGRQGGQAR